MHDDGPELLRGGGGVFKEGVTAFCGKLFGDLYIGKVFIWKETD